MSACFMYSIAMCSPNDVFNHMASIRIKSANAPYALTIIPGIFGACAKSTYPGAADATLQELVCLLQNVSSDTSGVATTLNEISNLKESISSKEVLVPYMPTILSFKSFDTVTVSALEDYMEGYVMISQSTTYQKYLLNIVFLCVMCKKCCDHVHYHVVALWSV